MASYTPAKLEAVTATEARPANPNANRPNGSRLGFIDVARAIAASLVMLQHSLEGAGFMRLDAGDFATTWFNLGQCGITVFFFVSGFIIPVSLKKKSTYQVFWLRRISRIYPLYLFIFFCTFIGYTFLLGIEVPSLLLVFASHLVMLQEWIGVTNYVGGSWTLFIELIWYATISFMFFFTNRNPVQTVVIGLLVYMAIICLAGSTLSFFPFGRVTMLAMCLVGYLFLLHFDDQVNRRMFLFILLAFVAVSVASVYFGFYNRTPVLGRLEITARCVGLSWGVAGAIFVALYVFRAHSVMNNGWLRYMGEISYSIYLVHSLVILALEKLGVTGLPLIAIAIPATIFLASLTYRFIERPGIALGRRLENLLPKPVTAASRP